MQGTRYIISRFLTWNVETMKVSVIIPVLNEEGAIANVINDIPKTLVQEIIVVDNGCTDRTAEIAHQQRRKSRN